MLLRSQQTQEPTDCFGCIRIMCSQPEYLFFRLIVHRQGECTSLTSVILVRNTLIVDTEIRSSVFTSQPHTGYSSSPKKGHTHDPCFPHLPILGCICITQEMSFSYASVRNHNKLTFYIFFLGLWSLFFLPPMDRSGHACERKHYFSGW